MKIKYTKEHDVTFSIEYFEATEGGMNHDSYGPDCKTLEEAINALEQANNSDRGRDCEWRIVCNITTTVRPS